MNDLTQKEIIIIYNLTKQWLLNPANAGRNQVKVLHDKASKELSFRGAFL